MRPTRRQFIEIAAATGVAAMVPWRRAYAYSQSAALQKYIQPLRGVSLPPYASPGIPVALPDAMSVAAGVNPLLPNGLDHYSITVAQYTDQLHPSLPATKLWGYADGAHGAVNRHLGGVIVAQRGKPVQLTFTNTLPPTHILPVDVTLPGANQAQNRLAVHLHGGLIPWMSDGGPHDWFDPLGSHGLSFLNNSVAYPAGPLSWQPNQAEYYWSMDLSARMLWYHDHAWGTTRLNAYAGVATALMIRDPLGLEGQLIANGLPGYIEAGGREIPLVVQDKIFKNAAGPNAAKFQQYETPIGDLWYPYMYETTRWKASNGRNALPIASCIPEFFGDTMLMNGTVYPSLTVEPRRYRFRLLNACNAKFLNLQLFIQDTSVDGITLNAVGLPTNPVGPKMTIIGMEGGFLPAPTDVNVGTAATMAFNPVTMDGNVIVAPAERLDFIVDFNGLAPGTKLIFYTDAPSPFPVGDPRNDYYPGSPNPTITTPGFGPNTRQLMQIVIGPAVSPADPPLSLAGLKMEPAPLVPPGAGVINGVTQLPPGCPVRQLTLNESFDICGRLIQTIGTNTQLVKGTFGRAYMDPATENVAAGATEVWQIANLTGDTHPIHFHLVNMQIVSRQPFKMSSYNGTPVFTGPAYLPRAHEMGWKETIRMNPGEVITVIAKFDLPVTPFTVPFSPRFPNSYEYVYHCHILEHEEHDMMRPLIVT